MAASRLATDSSSAGLLSYDPGGGHTDQLRDLSLALAIAELTNRTVLWPKYFHHRDVNVLTARSTVARLARTRSRLSSVIEIVRSPVQLIEQLATAHDFPRCDEGGANASSCVVWLEAPEANASVSAALRGYAALQYAPWVRSSRMLRATPRLAVYLATGTGTGTGHVHVHVHVPYMCRIRRPFPRSSRMLQLRRAKLGTLLQVHFHSMLDVLSARLARPKRYPITTWERELKPAACTLRYRADVLDAARRALRKSPTLRKSHTNRDAIHLAAHVRALRSRDRGKAECEAEWVPRLRRFVASANSGRAATPRLVSLYIASDTRTVLPRARQALGNLSVRVSIVSARDADAWRGSRSAQSAVHPDPELRELVLDVAAVLDADAFSPAPRSGFSVHLAAMRACERGEACQPALGSCTPFASTGCGGRFPPEMLRNGYEEEREAARVADCRAKYQRQRRQRRQCEFAADLCPHDELLRYGMGIPERGPMSDRECRQAERSSPLY